ncbi:MAG TPA: peptidoglycan DD-metalloendopeptidase family protein [Myxococcales bacterium LLY-WYZ-16_1]|jgi:murein DD-endopeptidase MepM/ murein hydrolase activator NlpD|nr:peptidoglycan DD-metalloendopeptidase family protein [Myxococcales bacterium LLY-WYZ-16_1]
MNSAVSGVPFETRHAASSDPDPQPENRALRDAAAQLEAVFLQSLFDEMAKTVETSDLFPEAPGREMYRQWFRKEVAQDFAKAGGVGLSDMIHAQLADAPDPMGRVRDLQHRLQPKSVPKGADGAGALGPSALGLPPPSGGPRRGGPPAAGPVTSAFGPRMHPVTGRADHHNGVDVAVPVGSPVRSPFSGTVVEVGEDPNLGVFVKVEHAGGYRSLFAHLSEARVQVGAWVSGGQQVAESGNTGRSTGPHLHYGLYRNGEPVDPRQLIHGLSESRR